MKHRPYSSSVKWFFFSLLLAFFACDTDSGINRKLPPSYSNATDSIVAQPDTVVEVEAFENIDTIPRFKFGEGYTTSFEGETRLDFGAYKLVFDGELEYRINPDNDTIDLFEFVGDYVLGRRMRILSNDSTDEYKLYVSIKENIDEQFQPKDPDIYERIPEEWYKNRVQWSGYSDFVYMRDTVKNVYRFPILNGINGFFELRRENSMGLRDTFVYYSSEGGGNTSTLVYKGKPCYYRTYYGIVKIERITGGEVETKYLRIGFSYGC